MSDFIKTDQLIPVDEKDIKYSYQCEDINFLFAGPKEFTIKAYADGGRGLLAYPNKEKDEVKYYDLQINKFTNNTIECILEKHYKDGRKHIFLVNYSFALFVNAIFKGREIWTDLVSYNTPTKSLKQWKLKKYPTF